MRNTNKCPKCGGDAICSVPGGGYSNVNQPHFHLGALTNVPITRYLCSACGYVELWVDDPDDIAKVTDKFGTT
jgi:predicted nucleic-acid-binding Zn-ribbon protein